MYKYYSDLFDDLIQDKIEPYTTSKKHQHYTFAQHFKNIIEGEKEVVCTKCWSFNHKNASHQGNVERYDNPCHTYRHLPIVEDFYWCPYGCDSFEQNKSG